MLFNCFCIFCKFQNLSICNNLLFCFVSWHHFFNTVTIGFTNKANMFIVNHTVRNFHLFFIHTEIIWCNRTLYNIFTKTPRAFNKNIVIIACYKINSKHYASCFREYHHLNCSTQCYCHMVKTLFYTVVCGTICECRCVAFFYFFDNYVSTAYI